MCLFGGGGGGGGGGSSQTKPDMRRAARSVHSNRRCRWHQCALSTHRRHHRHRHRHCHPPPRKEQRSPRPRPRSICVGTPRRTAESWHPVWCPKSAPEPGQYVRSTPDPDDPVPSVDWRTPCGQARPGFPSVRKKSVKVQ